MKNVINHRNIKQPKHEEIIWYQNEAISYD